MLKLKIHFILLLAITAYLINPFFLNAQNKPQRPGYSAYYYHRVEHFKALPNTKGEIIFLGDSITDGAEWAELTNNIDVKNRGISGDITSGVLYRLDEATESKPSKIFIMIGINDLATGLTADKIFENYTKIIETIKEQSPATEIYIESLLPVNDEFKGFPKHSDKTEQIIDINRRLAKLAEEKGAVYVDLFSSFAETGNKLKKELTEDGLHINGDGYLLWYSLIKKWL